MAKPKKCVVLTGNRKPMECKCPKCGHKKRLEYRKNGDVRRICGASEIPKLTNQPDAL